MCVAVPMKVIEISDYSCLAEIDGVEKRISLMALENVRVGDYIMAHAGLAIAKMDEAEAEKTLSLMRAITDATDRDDA
jgi:hydrogenase expression/formation protein HypC